MAAYPPYTPQPYPPQVNPYTPPVPRQEIQQVGIKGRPVSSIEEVRATSIDFDGSIFFFPDIANKKIYTKQINLDGTSTLNVYELKPTPVEPSLNPSQFVTREEFESVLRQLQSSFLATQQQAPPQKEVEEEKPKIEF